MTQPKESQTTCKKHSYVGGGDKDRHFIKCKVCGQEKSEKPPTTTYYFWKAPYDGAPEFTSGGNGISIIPGMGQWVLLHPSKKIPEDAISVQSVVDFLEKVKGRTNAARYATILRKMSVKMKRIMEKVEALNART